jgi:ArsR family transcriptional regulator
LSKTKLNKRLARLTSSGICPGEDASKYSVELKQLAEEIAEAKTSEKQSRFFKALADKTRLRILSLLRVREMCVCEIMIALDLTQPTASHHLGILGNAGLLNYRKEGKWVYYSLANLKLFENLRKLGLL